MKRPMLCLLALMSIVGVSSSAVAGDPAVGQTLWARNCSVCHGAPQLSPTDKAAYSPSVIANAIATVLPMTTLASLTAADLDNIATYIGVAVNAHLNYEGLWWASPPGSESGWGINLAHQYNTIFASWFTYDANGKAWWLVMTAFPGAGLNANTYSGALYATTGPAFNAQPFDPSLVK